MAKLLTDTLKLRVWTLKFIDAATDSIVEIMTLAGWRETKRVCRFIESCIRNRFSQFPSVNHKLRSENKDRNEVTRNKESQNEPQL